MRLERLSYPQEVQTRRAYLLARRQPWTALSRYAPMNELQLAPNRPRNASYRRLGMPGGSVGNGESAYADRRILCGVFGGWGGLSGCGSGVSARPGLARRAAHPAMSGCGSAEG